MEKSSVGFILSIRHEINPKCFFFHFTKAFKNYYIINQLSQNEVLCEMSYF